MSRTSNVGAACWVLLLCLGACSALSRQKRIVGGEPASPPPPGASEAEDVVVNPALVSVQPTTTTTVRTTTPRRPIRGDEDDGPIVFLRRGRREARVKGRKDPDGIYSFKGIRYAEAPIGNFRFQRPRRTKMEGDVDATSTAPPCPQTIGQQLVGSEDCLFLNVFSPDTSKESGGNKYPVLFWIHGGGFRKGSGSQYGVSDLVKKGLVVVTTQYRLGSLGFLSTNRKELPGNAGLFDLTASLRWVRQYIQFFGGDPGRIIIAGQGSGASAANMLSFTYFSKHWIKGVFAMSGSAISSFAVDEEPAQTAKAVSAIDDCHSVRESLAFVRCMQKLPLDTIIRGDDKLQVERVNKDNAAQSYITSISKLLNPGPAVEGEDDMRFLPNFLTGPPAELLQRGNFARVPLLSGVTRDETSTSAKGGGVASKLLGQVEATQELLQNMVPLLLPINTGILGNNTLSPLLNNLFSNTDYLKGITSSLNGVASTLDQIIEMTTDALFNLPAFLTTQYWSKQSNAYLYRFEHDSPNTAANQFLKESPLTDQPADSHVEGVGHGDDLLYLFDVLTLEGEPTQTSRLSDPMDRQVREYFTDMVAEFARSGEPTINGQRVKPFRVEEGNYIVVNSTPTVAKGFRKCQMGLWAGLTDVLKSSECNFLQLGALVGSLEGLTMGVTNTLTQPTNALRNTTTGLTNATAGLTSGLGGLLGGGQRGTQRPLLGLG